MYQQVNINIVKFNYISTGTTLLFLNGSFPFLPKIIYSSSSFLLTPLSVHLSP